MRKDQYILKNAYISPMNITPTARGSSKIDLSERRYIDEDGEPRSTGLISFFNPDHISALLCHYSALKLETKGHYSSDFFYLLEDFDNLLKRALYDHPMYRDIIEMKFANKTTAEIQKMVEEKYHETHSVQFISSLWRNKIPKLIAEREQNDFLIAYCRENKIGKWKRCSCCHEWKLATTRFFTKNRTSKDGFYSLCKECRRKKLLDKNK
jgi:hypothetical protein